MKSKLKIYIKNIVFVGVFFTALGALFNYFQIQKFVSDWYYWTTGGMSGGLLLSLAGSVLDRIVLKKRKIMLNGPWFQMLKEHFALEKKGHLLAGRYNQYPISIGWNILPAGKIPKPGIFIFIVFQPCRSEQVFEIKKHVQKTNRLIVESFYIYQFIQVKDIRTFPLKKIKNLIESNIKAIKYHSGPPHSDKCINCNMEIKQNSYRIVNDIPVPICDNCVRKVG